MIHLEGFFGKLNTIGEFSSLYDYVQELALMNFIPSCSTWPYYSWMCPKI